MIRIETIDELSPHLEAVKRIWRANSKWLGYYPEGAFFERARNRKIIVALQDETCCGYVIYYTTQGRKVGLTHLCIEEGHQGKGLARRLVDELRKVTRNMLGIGLSCRRDFPSWTAWPKLGFVAGKEKTGRSSDGHELTHYWMAHAHPSLLEMIRPEEDEGLDVVMDANVFFDLDDPTRNGAEESLGLVADWIQSSVHLCLTEEIFNEISRQKDASRREERLRAARKYDILQCSTEAFLAIEAEAKQIIEGPRSDRDDADIRQLARAIAAQATTFVTRDVQLLAHADEFYIRHGLSILRPAELIGQFEELRNERQYQRDRLAGTRIQKRRCSYAADVASAFHDTGSGEKRRQFEQRISLYFSDPDRFACYLVTDEPSSGERRPLAMYVIEKMTGPSWRVPLFRTSSQVGGPRTSNTLFRTLLAGIIQEISLSRSGIVVFDEGAIGPEWETSLRDAGFVPVGSTWAKSVLRTVDSHESIGVELGLMLDRCSCDCNTLREAARLLTGTSIRDDPLGAWEIEHLLWPAKILGCGIPSFVVPIKPRWATDLFDSGLGNNTLLGADMELALNPESVYYRAVLPSPFRPNGRILWYVSDDKRIVGSKRIRACSRLVDVVTGPAKTLYRQFRRLGVYEWRHVLKTAKGVPEGRIMALRFDDTERLRRPLKWNDSKRVLRHHGVRSNLQSPVEIPEAAFAELYSRSRDEPAL